MGYTWPRLLYNMSYMGILFEKVDAASYIAAVYFFPPFGRFMPSWYIMYKLVFVFTSTNYYVLLFLVVV